MGKIIAITGAGDGLGRALARRFAKDGDIVILLGRTRSKVEAVVAELGAPHMAVLCDVGDAASVNAAFAQIAAVHPKIDVLINNAAVFVPFKLADATDAQIMALTMTNFVGPILVSRAALPLLRSDDAKTGGHIINLSSESVRLQMPMLWLYTAAKQGVETLSEMWQHELKADNIRVTVVRAGQMMDETKTASSWPREVSIAFTMANAEVGLKLIERPISHYNSATDVFHAVVNLPADLHVGMVTLSADRRV
jgi:meso-butanediol dehydrogenase / (S,S)-butanediol dehydrogenase / diacetyl reductase